jgi:hypothetical protein
LLATAALNVAMAIWSIVRSVQHYRAECQAKRTDMLLRLLCVQAYQMHHAPVWQAWANVMGDISVEVLSKRRPWSTEL